MLLSDILTPISVISPQEANSSVTDHISWVKGQSIGVSVLRSVYPDAIC